MTEQQAIEGIVSRNNVKALEVALKEGRELLKIEPFPWEWVTDIVGGYWDKDAQKTIEDPEFYHKWLTKVLDQLEAEAKKQGKL